jgi:hypothetical protein
VYKSVLDYLSTTENMEYKYRTVKDYKVYEIVHINVFGFTAFLHRLRYTFKSFGEYNQAEKWIMSEGIINKQYVIMEVFQIN